MIGLPANLFYGTGIPAAILVFARTRSRRQGAVHRRQPRLRGRQEPELPARSRHAAHRDHLPSRGRASDKYAYLATPAEIAENDFNLNIPRYVDTFEEEEEIDLMAVRKEREQLKARTGEAGGADGRVSEGAGVC